MRADRRQDDALALPLSVQRERAIELLSRHFAHDVITLDELERRIEKAYQARSGAELADLTRDLPADAGASGAVLPTPTPRPYAAETDRIVSIMTEAKRSGVWRPARDLSVWSIMSETRLDLTDAALGKGVTEIRLMAVMTSFRVTIPPGVRLLAQVDSFMSSLSDESAEPLDGSDAPVVRLTGFALMSEIKVRVKLR